MRLKLLLLLGTTTLALVAAEIMIRALSPGHVVLFPRYQTSADYNQYTLRRNRPNEQFWHTSRDGSWHFTLNANGFRGDVDYPYDKAPGTTRVLCLGDSHTLGFEAREEYTFPRVIERYLTRRGHAVEVLNTGVAGFSTAEELVFLEQEGIKYQPDVVVLAFYANDLIDNVRSGLFHLQDGALVEGATRYAPGVAVQDLAFRVPTIRWFAENSYMYSLAFNSAWATAKALRILVAQSEAAEADAARDPGPEYAVAPTEQHSAYELRLAVKLLERLYRFCREHGVELIILEIPNRTPDGGSLRPSFPRALRAAAAANSDHFVPITSSLRDYDGVVETHVPHGQNHISEFTHGVLGVHVAKIIETAVDVTHDRVGDS